MTSIFSGLPKAAISALALFTSLLFALLLGLVVPGVPKITVYTGVTALVSGSVVGLAYILYGLSKTNPSLKQAYLEENGSLVMDWLAWIGMIHSLIMILGVKFIQLALQNPELTFSTAIIIFSFLVAFKAIKPKSKLVTPEQIDVITFSDEPDRRPDQVLSITLRDKKRLYIYQTARLLLFSAVRNLPEHTVLSEVDQKRRLAEIRFNEPLLSDKNYLKWKLHLLAAGSAAESLYLKAASIQAADDLNDFATVGVSFLQLDGRLLTTDPQNQREALVQQIYIDRLLKGIWSETREFLLNNREAFNKVYNAVKSDQPLYLSEIKDNLSGLDMGKIPTVSFPIEERATKSADQTDNVVSISQYE